jgi:pimeloyl-ACP methyl ester carboxylesterase
LNKTYVYVMYGLGGAMFSAGMEYVLAANVRKLPNVVCPETRSWSQWESIANEIKKQPKGSRTVVVGHSMGAATATYVTDLVPVDLLVLYDLAGKVPSKLGKNTAKCIDIYDTIPDLVPEWRVEAVAGYEKRIDRWYSQHGHTGQDDSVDLMRKVIAEIKKLAET